MSIIGVITDEEVAVWILDHMGLASRAPPRGRPRRPGQQLLPFEQAGGALDGIDPPSAFD
jgi:hypothetical protein